MGRVRRLWAMIGAVLSCAFVSVGLAAPVSQQGDGLDTPLLAANMCGDGAASDTHFTLAATGDTFPHENIQAVGEAQGYDYLFDHIRPFLKAADLAYTNFDGAMLAGSAYTGYPAFNYNPQLATALKNAGVGVVSTANNHVMDRGPQGLDATLSVLEAAGIAQHGTVTSAVAGAGGRPVYLPLTLAHDGVSIKLAFLSFSWGTNGIPDPYNQVNLLWQTSEYGQQGGIRQEVLDAVAQARREADVVIVAAHWGYEYQFFPDAVQIEGARQLAAAGADVILGAQSHTLQPVDVIETNGRRTLVIYSLANFIASQGAFQGQYYSATSIVLYVGLVRHADGRVAVTGYRYLPTLVIDNDTRPAPLPAGYDDVLAHVRAELRDPNGLRQVSDDPAQLGSRVEVCPKLTFGETPDAPIGGDFAQHLLTLGSGTTPYGPSEVRAVWGLPLGMMQRDLAGDCTTATSIMLTERQRLELHPDAPWPFRVTGTQIGTAVYEQRYGATAQRQTNLDTAFADPAFRDFFIRYGGLSVFGYPISGALEEDSGEGHQRTVQYFERARFELVPEADAADLLGRVQLGLLGREFAGINSVCGTALAAPTPTAFGQINVGAVAQPTSAANNGSAPAQSDAAPLTTSVSSVGSAQRLGWWLLGLGALAGIVILIPPFVRGYRRELRLRARHRQLLARRKRL